jgi:hypothetical protein
MKEQITFILPTKNRVVLLNSFFKNIYKNFNKLNPKYVIVDASNEQNHSQNKLNLKKYKNIRIIRQKKRGIQIGCIEAISLVNTKFATFLYDDDVMGKYVKDIYLKNLSNPNIFSLGCGKVESIKKKIDFKKLSYLTINKDDLLACYYGSSFKKLLQSNEINGKYSLPVSPICTSFAKSFLFKWKKILFEFVKNNNFRKFVFFERDVGPDLLLYLMSIDDSYKKINFFYPYSVKFSSHDNSISIIYGNSFLRIGYWLARVCFFNISKFENNSQKNKHYSYLITIGIYLIFLNLFNFYYFKNICKEVWRLIKLPNKFSIKYFCTYTYRKILHDY